MEPSRDDFIIAIRSAFLKKGTKQRFSLLALLLFSITLFFLGKFNIKGIDYLKLGLNEIVYRTSFIASIPEKYLSYSFNKIDDHINLYKKYDFTRLKYEELKLKKFNTTFLEAENKRLKKALEDITYSSKEKFGKVLIDKQSPFLKSIVINKGSKNSIAKGMAIMNDNYLVGKVVEVNYSTSRVLLLSDLNSKIPVTIEPGNIQSIISGDGENSGVIQYKNEKKPIENGSIVYTSGAGKLFKAGIPIGKVILEEKKPKIIFFVDFEQLRFVKILSFEEEKN